MNALITRVSLNFVRLIAAVLCTFIYATTAVAVAQDLNIENYNLVGKTRISRVEFDFTYTAQVRNTGSDYQNVSATLTSNSPYTMVITADLDFGDVASGDTALSQNTFTIRQNRRYPFSWDNLSWQFSHDEVVGDVFWVGPGGGTYSDLNGTLIAIPPGALIEDRMISVLTHLNMATLSAPAPQLGGALFGPSGLVFAAPISVTFSLNADFPPGTELPIFTFDEGKGAWSATEFVATVNSDQSSATAELTHFTDYIIMGEEWVEIFGAFTEPFRNTCEIQPYDALYDHFVAKTLEVFPIGDDKAWDFSAHYPSWGYGCYGINGIQFVLTASRSINVDGRYVPFDAIPDDQQDRLVGSEGSYMTLVFDTSLPIESADISCGDYQLVYTATVNLKLVPRAPEATLEVGETDLCVGETTNVKARLTCGGDPYKDQLVSFISGSGSISPDEGITDETGFTPESTYTAELEGVDDIKGSFDAYANMPISGGRSIIPYVPITVDQCIAGLWHLSPVTQFEECRETFADADWWTEDEFPGFDANIELLGGEDESVITASLTADFGPQLSGNWDRDTGAFDLAVNTSNPSQCGYLFSAWEVCGEAIDCRFEACQNTTRVEGVTSAPVDGVINSLDAEYTWFLSTTFSYAYTPGPGRGTNTWMCRGNATLSGSR